MFIVDRLSAISRAQVATNPKALPTTDGEQVMEGICLPGARCELMALVLSATCIALIANRSSAQVTTDATAQVPAAPAQLQNGAVAAPAITPDPTIIEAGDVFLPGSRVYIRVEKKGLGHEHGVVGLIKQGRIDLNAARNAGSLVFDMASFSADTPDARKYVGLEGATDATTQQQVNENMRGDAVLSVTKFPTATFVVKQIAKLDKPSQRGLPQYQLTGDFTLHGVTKPIQVVADAEDQGLWLHLRGGFTMLQTNFGMTPFTKAFGAVGVADQLNVYGDLWISKQRQVAQRTMTTR